MRFSLIVFLLLTACSGGGQENTLGDAGSDATTGLEGYTAIERTCEGPMESSLSPSYIKYYACQTGEPLECGQSCLGSGGDASNCTEPVYELEVACGGGGDVFGYRALTIRKHGNPIDSEERAMLMSSLLPLDTLKDAVTYLELSGATPSHYKKTDEGYDLVYDQHTSGCSPIVYERFWVHVSRDGEREVFDQVELSRRSGCT